MGKGKELECRLSLTLFAADENFSLVRELVEKRSI